MASKKTLNVENLERLGARRLAELLVELTRGDAEAKRRLRIELAGQAGQGEVAREVRKRLASLERAGSFVDQRRVKALAADLETQRRAIAGRLADEGPGEAHALIWRFLDLADWIFERCGDVPEPVHSVFRTACQDAARLAEAAGADPEDLADRTFAVLRANTYGELDQLLDELAPQLGEAGLARLKALLSPLVDAPDGGTAERPRPLSQDSWKVRSLLRAIADLQGDVDGYIAHCTEAQRQYPGLAAEIAIRLVDAGRPADGLAYLDDAVPDADSWHRVTWEDARALTLEALGREAEAQEIRWASFARTLDSEPLRAYLKRLPDFDDLEAEERAIDLAAGHTDVRRALAFLIAWPALDRAARLVLDRAQEIDGDHYDLLTPAAEALEARHPLAATLLKRAMIAFALDHARAKRYPHAKRHLADCARLAARIDDFGGFETHDAFEQRLRRTHGRKYGFWTAGT
jgi:hypothetical protein